MNPRKPTKLKVIQGTYRADRAAPREPQPEPCVPDVPSHLSVEAAAEWARISVELHKVGLLARIDRAALSAYCEAWSDWIDASKHCANKIDADGKVSDRKVIKTTAGNFVENPYFSIKKRAMELMHKFAIEFGMTPASRTRINTLLDESDGKAKDSKNYA